LIIKTILFPPALGVISPRAGQGLHNYASFRCKMLLFFLQNSAKEKIQMKM
jgi:hypothetical protein